MFIKLKYHVSLDFINNHLFFFEHNPILNKFVTIK